MSDEKQPPTEAAASAPAGTVRPRVKMSGSNRSSSLSAMMSALFLAHVGNSVYLGVQPPLIAAIYFPMSILCFFLMWRDKSAAQSKAWRISEIALVFCCLCGGWPGFYLAQKSFGHKIRKFLFNLLSFVCAGVNIYLYRKVTSFGKD